MRYLTLLITISITIISSNVNTLKEDDIRIKGNALRVFNEFKIDSSKEDKFDNFWTSKNQGYLSESQKERLNELMGKVNDGIKLSITEYNELKIMKAEVIKNKLGSEKFNELEKLVNKRDGNAELTLPERQRLYELNKEARE